jgi:hypothetical protein
MIRSAIVAASTIVAAVRPTRRKVKNCQFKESAAFGAAHIEAAATGAVAAGKVPEWDLHVLETFDWAGSSLVLEWLILARIPDFGLRLAHHKLLLVTTQRICHRSVVNT